MMHFKKRFWPGILLILILSVVLILPVHKLFDYYTGNKESNLGFNSEDDGIAFLNRYDWKVDTNAEVFVNDYVLPYKFDPAMEIFDKLQVDFRGSIKKYKGKHVKVYNYVITNFPLGEDYKNSQVTANIWVLDNEIIAAGIVLSSLYGEEYSIKGRSLEEIIKLSAFVFEYRGP